MTRHRPPKISDAERSYGIGYRKPPKEHAFKKGECANPSGRPRKQQSNGDIVQKLLSQILVLRIDGKPDRLTGREALFRAQFVKAVKGDRNAADFLLRHVDDAAKTLDMAGLGAEDRAIITSCLEQLGTDPEAMGRTIGQLTREDDDG